MGIKPLSSYSYVYTHVGVSGIAAQPLMFLACERDFH